MGTFEERISNCYDDRILTLGKIKSRSIGADALTLTALTVLTYAQLEGGVKDLVAFTIRDFNMRKVTIAKASPYLLKWRNPEEIDRFRSFVNFEMIVDPSPFDPLLARQLRLKGINRKSEFNQMDWAALRRIYTGLGLNYSSIATAADQIDNLVAARNQAAHHGMPPNVAIPILEGQLRSQVDLVQDVLTDLGIRLLPYFSGKTHLR